MFSSTSRARWQKVLVSLLSLIFCFSLLVAVPVSATSSGTLWNFSLSSQNPIDLMDVQSFDAGTSGGGGGNHNLAVKSDHTVWAWGYNSQGELGIGAAYSGTAHTSDTVPVQVFGLNNSGFLQDVTSVAAGNGFSLALKSDGTVWAWGGNNVGQLGINNSGYDHSGVDYKTTPVQVIGLPVIRAISTGEDHSLALDNSGNVWGWGASYYGQTGPAPDHGGSNYIRIYNHQPVKMAGLPEIKSISAGGYFSLALDLGGNVWAWGHNNSSGELGQGSDMLNKFTPVKVKGTSGSGFLSNIDLISAGYNHALAYSSSNGSIYAWGSNYRGALAQPDTMFNSALPIVAAFIPAGSGSITGSGGVMISAGMNSSLVKNPGDTISAWGGDFGNSPVVVTSMHDITDISAGATCLALGPARTATTSTITSSNPTINYGDPVTFTSTVSGSSGYTPTGTVQFGINEGFGVAGDGTLGPDATASLVVNWLPVGDNNLMTATYQGDFNNLPSPTSTAIKQTVIGYPCTLTLTSSQNPSIAGSPITLTFTASGQHGVPNGYLEFYEGYSYLGWSYLDSQGQATYTTGNLAVGTYSYRADFYSYGAYKSGSASLSQVVTPPVIYDAVMTLGSSLNPSVADNPVTLTVTLSGDYGTPTGTVDFYNDSTFLVTKTLDAQGQASYTTDALSAGAYAYQADFQSFGTYKNNSASLSQVVNSAFVPVHEVIIDDSADDASIFPRPYVSTVEADRYPDNIKFTIKGGGFNSNNFLDVCLDTDMNQATGGGFQDIGYDYWVYGQWDHQGAFSGNVGSWYVMGFDVAFDSSLPDQLSFSLPYASLINQDQSISNGDMFVVAVVGDNNYSDYAPDNGHGTTVFPVYKRAYSAVSGSNKWWDSGIDIKAADPVAITAGGSIYFSNYGNSGPDGAGYNNSSALISRFLPLNSLVGCIGDPTVFPPPPAFFEIGKALSFTASSSGRLWLGVNASELGNNSGSWDVNIDINTTPYTITPTALPDGMAGLDYGSVPLAVFGGSGNFSWSWWNTYDPTWGQTPPGLTLDAGTITGTPTQVGNYSVTIQVNETTSGQKISKDFVIHVKAPVRITTLWLPEGTNGESYSEKLSAINGVPPYSWSMSSNPSWLSLTGDTLSGTPDFAGPYDFTVQVTDSIGMTDSQDLTIAIQEKSLTITSSGLLPGVVKKDYSQTLQGDYGSDQLQWALDSGNLPPGLDLDANGQISGQPTAAGNYSFTVRLNSGSETVTQDFSILVNAPGEVWAWGNGGSGALGNGETNTQSSPVQVNSTTGLTQAVQISGGSNQSLALDAASNVWSWGSNYGNGQLGRPLSNGNNLIPGKVVKTGGGDLSNIVSISSGNLHGMTIDATGQVWVWGDGQQGQLGNGTATFSRNSADQVPGMSDVVAIVSSNGYHCLAVKSDGSVWGWGYNSYGQVGNGDYSPDGSDIHTSSPSRVQGVSDAVAVAAGWGYSLALDKSGQVWAWGSNSSGQLGLGYTESSPHLLAAKIPGLNNIVAISSGSSHSLALDKTGQVWAWGANSNGQLGQGNTSYSASPVKVLGSGGTGFLNNIKSISTGSGFSAALDNDGNIWTWGQNSYGQLGNGTEGAGTDTNTPHKVNSLSRITGVSDGNMHALALKNTAGPVISHIPDIVLNPGDYTEFNLDQYVTDAQYSNKNLLDWNKSDTQHVSVYITTTSDSTGRIAMGALIFANPNWSGSEDIKFTVTDPDGFSASDTMTVTVNPSQIGSSTTTLASSLNPSNSGDAVTFTATVSPAPVGGTVQFQDNGTNLGIPVDVVSGQALYTTSALSVDSHPITAIYSGDSHSAGSSGSLEQMVGLTSAVNDTVIDQNGEASVNQTVGDTTIITEISGSTVGADVTISAVDYGTQQPSGTGGVLQLGGVQYLDIKVSPSGVVAGAIAHISITSASVTETTTIWYWDGSIWVEASNVVVSGNTISFDVPVSALGGTPFAILGSGDPNNPVPELPALALLGLGLAGIAGYIATRRKHLEIRVSP